MPDSPRDKHRVVIAGSGVAGLEALSILSAVAGDRVETTVLSPSAEFALEALAIEAPFGGRHVDRFAVEDVCEAQGARFHHAALESVDPARRVVVASDGTELEYDSLLITVGAIARLPLAGRTIYFRGSHDADLIESMLADVLKGEVGSVVFTVPPGPARPIPVYELALETASFARVHGISRLQLTIVTPEERPLAAFGHGASFGVERLLDRSRIALVTGTRVQRVLSDSVMLAPSGSLRRADRVVAVPALSGPMIAGVPADGDGFVEADWYGRTPLPDVFAAGDGTVFPIKHGGLSARHAMAAATQIAARAGVDLDPRPLDPEIVAEIATGRGPLYLGGNLTRTSWDDDLSDAAGAPVDRAPRKVDAPFLYDRLRQLDPGCRLALG